METILQTSKLTKRYGKFTALADLDLTVQKGEVLGYLGPNGAGKSTTIRLLLGLIHPSSGSAQIFGLDSKKDKAAIHRRLAYVPSDVSLWPSLTGAETLHLLASIHGTVDEKYQAQLIKRFEFDPNKKVRAYSKGNKQKINLIAALAARPELLILDEPTTGLDPLNQQVFRDCIEEAKTNEQTVFLSSHMLEEVEALCDRVAVLQAGKLIEVGTLTELRHLSAVKVEATFSHQPPDLHGITGVSGVHIKGNHLTCQVQGSIDSVLKAVAEAQPLTFFSREPSLEELFLALYGEAEKATA